MSKMDTYLKLMADSGASDLFLSVGSPPYLKIDGATRETDAPGLAPGEVKELAYSMMNEFQCRQFELTLESNFAFSVEGVGRYRVNVYYQRGEVAVAVRLIKLLIPDFQQLGLPVEIAEMAMLKRGLVLIVGAAGCGKSTSLAAMIDFHATHADDHILTIEDPIEFLFPRRRSLIDQREVGIDTLSFGDALRNALREAPDVIMIGEIRDKETAQHAIAYAEAGHLCLSTMHANNANQAVDRIINFFPEPAHKQVLLDLSLNLEGVISQRLIHGTKGKRVLAVEVLRHSAYIAEMIRQGRLNEIKHEMERNNQAGVKTFDQSLFELYQSGQITHDEALSNADSHIDLALRMRLSEHHSTADAPALSLSEPPPVRYGRLEDQPPRFQWINKDTR